MQKPLRVAAIGELLWDLLPDCSQLLLRPGEKAFTERHMGAPGLDFETWDFSPNHTIAALGGAPANFAAILAQMSACAAANSADEVFLVSRIGNDPLGTQAREQLIAHKVRPDYISLDSSHSTGIVDVLLDDADQGPRYRIHKNVAWDYVPETPSLSALAPTLDATCFGTLAQRSPVTQTTLRSLVASTRSDCLRVFDVNLREPDWTAETVAWGCTHATILKMNQEEVAHVAQAISTSKEQTPLSVARFLLDRFPIQLVAITRGPHGSLMVTREAVHDHPGIPVHVADSIGAGDCFTAALTYYALRHRSLPVLAEAANHWGAWAATQRGGMPILDTQTWTRLEAAIEPSKN